MDSCKEIGLEPNKSVIKRLWCKWSHLEGVNELAHDKTNKKACAPSEDSDQPGHPPSLIRVLAVRMKKAQVLSYPLGTSEDSDQTGWMPRLIYVIAGCTDHFCHTCFSMGILGMQVSVSSSIHPFEHTNVSIRLSVICHGYLVSATPLTVFSSPEPSGSQGELIVYPCSGVRWNRLANQSQIVCGASLGRGNESLYKWSRLHDQDGRHTHIW